MADNSAVKIDAYRGRLPHQVISGKMAPKPKPTSKLVCNPRVGMHDLKRDLATHSICLGKYGFPGCHEQILKAELQVLSSAFPVIST